MNITVEEVLSSKDLKTFIKFPFGLYKGNEYYVPPIIDFEVSTLSRKKNPAFDHADAKYFLAKQDGKIVGRIAGIILNEELSEKKLMRFGWIDFIDDKNVSKALFDAILNWGKEQGAESIHGPMGFTDLDFEGSLIEGFDQLTTQATIYNHPYYHQHYENLGFEKACDWVELRGTVPKELPRRLTRVASIITSRFKLEVKKFKSSKQILKYANAVFELLNECYGDLYGYHPLTEKQIKYYVDMYFGFIRIEYVTLIVNENDDVVAFAISLPSLSKAFQKAKGSLYPFGFIHVLKAFKSNKHLDMFLIGVKPEYQKMGASPLIFHELLNTYINKGVTHVASGPMMEENRGVLNLWNEYQDNVSTDSIKRRCYIKAI
ncbi:MAG: N-acetyltransferase [Cyclobacteriaceae bacterium]